MSDSDGMKQTTKHLLDSVVVDEGHEGPPVQYETASDGLKVECRWAQAVEFDKSGIMEQTHQPASQPAGRSGNE